MEVVVVVHKLISYIISVLVCFTIFVAVPQLPAVGVTSVESLFTTLWLLLAVLVLTAHLRKSRLPVLFTGRRESNQDKNHIRESVVKEEKRDITLSGRK